MTPSALESGLAKLRECAAYAKSDTNINVRVYSDQADALLAYITPTIPNSWNADKVLKRHGLYRELAPPDRGATALRLLWLEQQNAALLAKIEAADRLADAVFDYLHDNLCTCAVGNDPCDWHKLWNAYEPFGAPQPAGGGE
jgi:hypothetical protein